MEQKKTLWIIAAVGVFLLVVVGAALILYSPSLHNSNEVAMHTKTEKEISPADNWMTPSSTPSNSVSALPGSAQASLQDNANTVQTDAAANSTNEVPLQNTTVQTNAQQTAPGTNQIQSDNVTVISGTTTVYGTGTTTIDLNTLKNSNSSYSSTRSPVQNVEPQNEAAAEAMNSVSDKQYSYTKTSEEEQTENVKSVTKKTSTSSSTAKSVSKSSASAKAASKTVAKTTLKKSDAPAASKIPDRWWVQAASYTTKKNADEARSVLEANKIPSEVFTWKDSGKLFYRVRVGPYTTKSEASYWQTQIKNIEHFAKTDSYVVNSSAKAVK